MNLLVADQELAVDGISSQEATEVVIAQHYLHRKCSISHAFGLYQYGVTVGVVTFGTPPSRHVQLSACSSNPESVIELNRLWVDDAMPRNTESWFVSRALRMLPPLIVVSYADTKEGHEGFVYRALNFRYAGLTDADRKTPRFDYVPPSGAHSRDAFRSGLDPQTFEKVRRLPKHRYWTVTGDRREQRQLRQMVTWPDLRWGDV